MKFEMKMNSLILEKFIKMFTKKIFIKELSNK
jgi:hypothetical protein